MTFEQYHKLIDKYGIDVDADLYLSYRNYLLGRIETDITYEDPNRHVTFVTYGNNGRPMRILNPIAIDNLLKHRTLEIKKQIVKDKINKLNEDFV
jgi:hypothetical protein